MKSLFVLERIFTTILLLPIPFIAECTRKHKPPSCKRTAFNRHTTNYRAWREQMTVCELLDSYNPMVRPSGRMPNKENQGPVVVKTSLHIRAISAISEKNMEYVAQFRFQQEWYDDRLRFVDHSEFRDFDFISISREQGLWIPDTFFQNEKDGWYHMVDQENKYIKVRSDGKVIYNRRLTLILACNMNLIRYPMDIQLCLIDFASYAYTTNDIVYEWDDQSIIIDESAKKSLPNFEISAFKNTTCGSITNTGIYSCLRVELRLKRVFSFFLLQLYLPSVMLVGVSWVSYWIDWKSTAARVPLAIVTLLTMITQSHAINSNLPPVNYIKAIDIWIGACVVFIFASLIEYAVVNYMGIVDEHRHARAMNASRTTRLSRAIDNASTMNEMESSLATSAQYQTWQMESMDVKDRIQNVLHRCNRRRNLNNTMHYDHDCRGLCERYSLPNRNFTEDTENEWTLQNPSEWMYKSQRKRVELIHWCSLLSEKGRAERIDIIARVFFPVAFVFFNIVYWSIYLHEFDQISELN